MCQNLVILDAAHRVAEYRKRFVEEDCLCMVSAEIRVHLGTLHQRSVTGLDDGRRCIGLNLKDSVVVASVLHMSSSQGL